MRLLRYAVAALALLLPLALTPAPAGAGGGAGPALPPPDGDLDYQLGGAYDPAPGVTTVVRDRTDEPAADRYNVCYVNAFQTQPDARRFWRERWSLVLKDDGEPVVDGAWGEWLLDVRTPRKRERIAAVVGRWVAGCAEDGFDAVEYDNLDSFSRSHGLIGRADARAHARLLTAVAHEHGLAAAQKNWAELGERARAIGFDLAVAEECGRWRECRRYVDVFGPAVLMVEYRRADFRWTCARFGDHPVLLADRELVPAGPRETC